MKKALAFMAKNITVLMILVGVAFAMPAFAKHDGTPHQGQHHGKMGWDKHDKTEMMVGYFMHKADKNGDRYISMSEHEALSAKMFYEADQNRDRALSHDEIVAHKMHEMKEMKDSLYENRQGGYNN